MTREVAVDSLVTDQFPVISIIDGYTKISGETSFTTTVWKDGVVQATVVTIAEIGTSGEYKATFTPDGLGFWKVEILIDYNKDLMGFEYTVASGDMTEIYDAVRRILGLNHENIFIDDTNYDANSQLVSARVRLFDSKTNCDAATDGGSETTGLIATYTLTTTWQAINKFGLFKQVLEP